MGFTRNIFQKLKSEAAIMLLQIFKKPSLLLNLIQSQQVKIFSFLPTIISESGERAPADAKKIPMVDAVLYALREIMEDFPEAILYGQDIGRRLGGVFRETATLAAQFGDDRVFNTAIQEAYLIGSTAGMCATGLKPIVEIQFGDYIFPGFNQLVTEIAKSCYLSNGKFPIQTLIRVPVGAYQGGGPYHSGSIETTLVIHKRIKNCLSFQCGRYERIDESGFSGSQSGDHART